MSRSCIFITGATGFIGSATAVAALKLGFRLRICLRKPSEKLEALLSEFSSQLEFVIVTDIADENAFDGKLDDVDYILHLASPLPHGTDKQTYFTPAVRGTLAILEAASKMPQIKKVVVTSSIAALIPLSGIPQGGIVKESTGWDLSVDESANFEDPANPANTPMRLYQASKLLANNATWKYRAEAKPHYSLVTLHPAFVFGHNPVQTSADELKGGSNEILWKVIMGGATTGLVTGVHIQDVAEAHIKSLDAKIVDGSSYLLVEKKGTGSDVARIINKYYPDVGATITEDFKTIPMPVDTTKAETELGISWRPIEEMVRDMMDQQLGFSERS